jgi:hypothetical protein
MPEFIQLGFRFSDAAHPPVRRRHGLSGKAVFIFLIFFIFLNKKPPLPKFGKEAIKCVPFNFGNWQS